jgi:hypothetical protein
MTAEDFIVQLRDRYETISKANLEDINSLIGSLSMNDMDLLWESFINSYEFNSPPKRAVFKKLMYKLGIVEYKKGEVSYSYCKSCGIGYPTDVRACYRCGKALVVCIGDKLPRNYVRMQRYCYMCKRFLEGIKGAECKLYGLGPHQWNMSQDDTRRQIEICKKCECRRCCYEERIYRNEFVRYADMTAQGEFVGPTGFEAKTGG